MQNPLAEKRNRSCPVTASLILRRLVCTLLGSCGQYFSKGSIGRRLDAFLVALQRYVLAKPPLPLHVEFDVQVSSHLALS